MSMDVIFLAFQQLLGEDGLMMVYCEVSMDVILLAFQQLLWGGLMMVYLPLYHEMMRIRHQYPSRKSSPKIPHPHHRE